MNTNASPSLYENVACRRVSSTSFSSSSLPRLRSYLLPPGTEYRVKRNLTLPRSEEHTSELQSLMRISYAVFCLKKKTMKHHKHTTNSKSETTDTNNHNEA